MHKIFTLCLALTGLSLSGFAQKQPKWTMMTSLDGYKTYNKRFSEQSGNNGTQAVIALPNGNVAAVVQLEKNQFAVAGLDPDMQPLWHSPVKGYPLGFGILHGKILLVCADDYNFLKSFAPDYSATLLDMSSGKILSEKSIYKGNGNYISRPVFFFSENDDFCMAIRETELKRGVKVVVPLAIAAQVNELKKKFHETRGVEVFSLNSELELIEKRKLNFPPSGYVTNLEYAGNGKMILRTASTSSFALYVYEKESENPARVIDQGITTRKYMLGNAVPVDAMVLPSKSNLNHVYEAAVFSTADKDRILLVSDYDLEKSTVKTTTETFTKDYFKSIVKDYKPANPKFEKVNFNTYKKMELGDLREVNKQILVSVSPAYYRSSTITQGVAYASFEDILLNVYDQNLQLQKQFALPRDIAWPIADETGMYQRGNFLYFFHNMTVKKPVFTKIDLSNWSINETGFFEREKNDHLMASQSVLFLKNGIYVPYLDFSTGFGGLKLKPYYLKASIRQ
ncbi:MAG: hypothetical protein INR69_12120 [Mucilaginibacter polytrichastri]|nr:hypothetical protein [Mucilaginibacter polytrichastri]